MSNVARFPSPHPDHTTNTPDAPRPDAEELRRLLDQLVQSLEAPAAGKRSEQTIRIRNFRSERFALVDELVVVLEAQGGQYLASSFDTGQYGQGYSPDMAIEHLCSIIEDYYDLLVEDEGHLSPTLNSHLRYLRSILRARE